MEGEREDVCVERGKGRAPDRLWLGNPKPGSFSRDLVALEGPLFHHQ